MNELVCPRHLLPFAVVLALLCALPAAAQTISVDIDRTEITIDEQLLMRVTVEGREGVPPTLPELPDFTVRFQGRSSQFQVLNGRSSASFLYSYLLIPEQVGSFEVGPVTVEIDGRAFATDPFRIRVLPASAQLQNNRDLFVRATVSTTSPYLGQQILFTWRFYHRVAIDSPRLEPMAFDGFLVEDLGEVRQYDDTINGQRFRISEIRKALFPQEVGTLTLEPVTLTVQQLVRQQRRGVFGGFGATRSRPQVLRTQPITLEVRPLPPAPADYSGLVGNFRLSARLSQREIVVGDSATLTLEVVGTGNVRSISQPPLPPLPSFKIYDDQPKSSLSRQRNGLSGSKTYGLALVPSVAGEQRLPGLSLTYFDPAKGSYESTRTPELTLRVLPGDGEERLNLTESFTASSGKVAVRMLDDDLLPLSTDLNSLQPPLFADPTDPALLTALLLPPGAWLALFLGLRRRQRWRQDVAWRRRSQALKKARQALKEVREHSSPGSSQAADGASSCLRSFIGDLLNIEGAALTPAETAENLRSAAVDEELITRVSSCLEQLEAAQYGARPSGGADATETVEALIQELHRALGSASAGPKAPSGARGSGAALGVFLGALLGVFLTAAAAAPVEAAVSAPGAPAQASDPGTNSSPLPSANGPVQATPSDLDSNLLFQRAGEAYDAQRYDEALALFQQLSAEGAGADLWYNLGNAAMRSGRLGAAVAAYRRALVLEPGHPEATANLSFARSVVKDDLAPPQASPVAATLLFWHYRLGLSQLASALLLFNLLLWLSAAALLLAPRPWRSALRWTVGALTVAVLALGISWLLRSYAPQRLAVIQPQQVEALTGPSAGAAVRFQLHAGTEVRLEEVRREESSAGDSSINSEGNSESSSEADTLTTGVDSPTSSGWVRIALPDGQQGWLPRASVDIIEL
ncbi:MAG: BatD family protein [Acidobacteriota bacterium]